MARLGLTQLPRKLAEHTRRPAPTYRQCFDAAVSDRFPAVFTHSRWTVDEADLDVIAAAMGMTPDKPVKSPGPHRAATEQAA
jgi:hypothetical protein